MGERNECAQARLTRLERFGLKGEVGDRGKHLEVAWAYPDGRRHFVIVPRTASDHRASLNARGDVRRLLRANNIQPPSAKVVLMQKAFNLPKVIDPLPDRLVRMTTDIEGLLDLVVDLQAQVTEQQSRLNNIRVSTTLSFDVPVAVTALAASPVVRSNKGGRSESILAALQNGNWHQRADIAAATKLDIKDVSSGLDFLRKKGFVERGLIRGMWRKKPQSLELVQTG